MLTVLDRFWSKLDKSDGCWLWTAACNRDGYGAFSVNGRMVKAHRFAYEELVGPIPDGLVIDHLCRNRECVNPAHLEPVTHVENVRRGRPGDQNRRKTHCPMGHPYDDANTIHKNGRRFCRACRTIHNSRRS